MTLWLDRLFTGGLLFLILFTPFAFGTVQPWAYTAMEVVVFALVMVWMIKLMLTRGQRSEVGGQWEPAPGRRSSSERLTPLALPLTLFIALCAFQLVPLPPEVLRAISPQTFEVYKQSLPGWPERVPYSDLASMEQGAGGKEQGAGSTEPAVKTTERSSFPASQLSSGSPTATWFPLSISAGLTKIDLLKFVAFAALFFLVWRYPFEEPFAGFAFGNPNPGFFILSREQRFLRSVVFTILGTGLLVAALGFIERFSWNGNILLWLAGYDSGESVASDIRRASGPFINPDHFANYLSLIFPVALGCALFRTFMVSKSDQYGLKIFCGFTVFLLFTGILLSLSRGGWISALLGIVILVWLAPWQRAGSREQGARSRNQRSEVRGQPSAPDSMLHAPSSRLARVARLSLITICVLLLLSLFFAGSGGREQVDARLTETIEQQGGLGSRTTVAKDTSGMIRDFPLLGVGLGAWPEHFLHYKSGPWSRRFFREAHNDYLEVLAETGMIGFGLLAWFFFVAGKRIVQGVKKSSSKYLPLLAGILSALGGMALHEWLDFSMQIPANAFLFTVLLAVGMRLAGMTRGQRSEVRDQRVASQPSSFRASQRTEAFRPAIVAVTAAVLIAVAIMQDQGSYPYNFRQMTSLAAAQELLLAHPTHGPYHWELLTLAGKDAPLEWQLEQANAAVWNDPNNPYYRDLHAWVLMTMERTEEALQEMTQSVTESPSLGTHVYLNAENLPSLSEEEQAAVEEGFRQALAKSYPEALNGLSEFYAKLDRFADQAALYEEAALKEADTVKKTELLINAGVAYLKAGSKEQGAVSRRAEGRGQRSEVGGLRSEVGGQRSEVGGQRSADARDEGNAKNATDAERNNAVNAKNAERAFRAAIAASPADPKPYQQLVTAIYAPQKDLAAAKETVSEGIKAGASALALHLSLAAVAQAAGSDKERKAALDSAKAEVEKSIKNGENPSTLYIAFADGARRAGDQEQEAAALLKALDLQPRSPDVLSRLAHVYSEKQNFDRAALYLNRIAQINPDSADVYFQLAVAEEARYRFADAGRAYARAVELAPKNENYQKRYEAFRDRVDRSRVTERRVTGDQ